MSIQNVYTFLGTLLHLTHTHARARARARA